jgi:hypothetical protein
MNDEQYLAQSLEQLQTFAAGLATRTGHLPEDDALRQLADGFSDLASGKLDLYRDGPALVSRLFTTYPEFAPSFPRDLLWFFGGDCLHFMPDNEIAIYQQLDDLRAEAADRGETLDMRSARASLKGLQ